LVQTSPELALVVRSLCRVLNDLTAQLTANHIVLSLQDRSFPETEKAESNNIISTVDLPNTTTPSLAVVQCSCGEGLATSSLSSGHTPLCQPFVLTMALIDIRYFRLAIVISPFITTSLPSSFV
jgi:hypothetical protein